jgi:hypothetical protein
MEYSITTMVAGSPGFIDIDEAEYKRIKSAITNLFELLFFEEKLDLVMENFQEYEVELLSIASRGMVFNDDDYFSMSRERYTVSRRIVNLLSACTMYLDQSVHHVNNIYGENSDQSKLLRQEIKAQYDQNFGFRAMKALRNYTQHRGFPIHAMKFSGEWLDIDIDENSRLRHSVIPLIYPSELAEDGKFKQTVLDELIAMNNQSGIDIRPLIRDYVEGIGKIHEKVREFIRPDMEKWEGVIDDTIKLYQNKFGAGVSLAGLAIVVKKDDNHWTEERTIFKEFIEKRRALERKNSVFGNLRKRYASNEIRKKDA